MAFKSNCNGSKVFESNYHSRPGCLKELWCMVIIWNKQFLQCEWKEMTKCNGYYNRNKLQDHKNL